MRSNPLHDAANPDILPIFRGLLRRAKALLAMTFLHYKDWGKKSKTGKKIRNVHSDVVEL